MTSRHATASLFGAVFLACAVALSGCSSARMSDTQSDSLFQRGQYDVAAKHLREGLDKQGGEGSRDSLLYMLDLGLALHSAGEFDESTKVFREADRVAEIKDYTSLSKETATLLVSENIQDYKAEEFENVLINTYLAMNYALQGNTEDALVEARRVNQKLYMMVSEGKRKYQQSAFARYLSAILYESEGNWNDAYVDYKNAYALKPSFPGLGRDLWRMARATENTQDMERWDQEFGLSAEDHQREKARIGKAEIVVLYENGISPVKRPNPSMNSVPKFYPRFNPVSFAEVDLRSAQGAWQNAGTTAVLDSIQAMAIENLDEKYGGIVAKKVAGMVAKGAVGYGVARMTNSPVLGELAGWILYKADKADLRSWNLLPQTLQVLRIPVEPGTYDIQVRPGRYGALSPKTVQVAPGKKVFVDFRYMP
ncbi:MAG: hypothetical protein P4M08_04945 [Oligoflexia bacterium]|nr:hypothetical protein [Oligoflexia bacterium]